MFNNLFTRLIFICTFFLAPLSLSGEILEFNSMHNLEEYLTPGSLIVFDIDNTLIEPVQELGKDQWFGRKIQRYIEQGFNSKNALEVTLKQWTAVQNITDMQLAEPGIDTLIKKLQKQGFSTIGLTTRGLDLCNRTIDQLQSVKIKLDRTHKNKKDIFFHIEKVGVLYRGGIIFTCNTHKGKALFKFLKKSNLKPSHVVFINDKHSHLLPVEEYCEKHNILFTGLRYNQLDPKVQNFRMDIADLQEAQFGKIVSDENAEAKLSESAY